MQCKRSPAVPAPVGAAINTVGSSVARTNFWKLRDAGATARAQLLAAAMARVGDAVRSNFSIRNGVIRHDPSGLLMTYGQLAAAAALLPPPANAPIVPEGKRVRTLPFYPDAKMGDI